MFHIMYMGAFVAASASQQSRLLCNPHLGTSRDPCALCACLFSSSFFATLPSVCARFCWQFGAYQTYRYIAGSQKRMVSEAPKDHRKLLEVGARVVQFGLVVRVPCSAIIV